MKTCIRCAEQKPLEAFHKHKEMKDGHINKCKTCVLECVKEWRKNNPQARKKEHERKWKKEGRRTREEYFASRFPNPIGRKVSSLKYAHKRRRLEEKMFKSELDEFAFHEAAHLCQIRNEVTGFKWHIDHIVPMLHKQACGLNSYANLQVVPATWNVRKNNKSMVSYWPTSISGY
jgi:hypothetical protein